MAPPQSEGKTFEQADREKADSRDRAPQSPSILMESPLSEDFPIGTRVSCVVTEVEPFGVIGTPIASPGVRVFLFRQEWAWRSTSLELGTQVHAGETFEAEVLGYNHTGLVISRKRTLTNPLKKFAASHRVGDPIGARFGFIPKRSNAGVNVWIGAGDNTIDGFVPRSELPPGSLDDDGFGLLAGDVLTGRILRFDKQSVVLSIREHLLRRDGSILAASKREPKVMEQKLQLGLALERRHYQQKLAAEPSLVASERVRQEIRTILLVEDEDTVASSLGVALERADFAISRVVTVEQAIRHLESNPVDLTILDRHLPGAEGAALLGSDAIHASRYVCLLTGSPSTDLQGKQESLSREVRFLTLAKPTDPADLLKALDHLVNARISSTTNLARVPAADIEAEPETTLLSQIRGIDQGGHLEQILLDLQARTGAEYACLLSYEPGPVFKLIAGRFIELTRFAQQELEQSPFGDVIRRSTSLPPTLLDRSSKRHEHLLNALPVRSLLGFGLRYIDPLRYGVFLLSTGAEPLKEITQSEREILELQITQQLIQRRFSESLLQNQTLLLKGLLTTALLHEIDNRLQDIRDYSAILADIAKHLDRPRKGLGEEDLTHLLGSIEGVGVSSKDLADLVRTFRDLFGSARSGRFKLHQIVERLLRSFRSIANRDQVRLVVDIPKDLPAVKVSAKHLEQPLLNLLINASEQMKLRGSAVRRIWITAVRTADPSFPLRISVRDTGPGIHAVDWERIFHLFFTTKPKGTGLGLFISRLLIESFGGRLRLESAVMFEGSEFHIDIPAGVLA